MTFPTGAPSEHGVDPVGLDAFLDAIDADPAIEPHGLIIQRHGRRVLEGYWRPHRVDRVRLVYSLSKTFTATALGLAIGDGLVDLDDLVADHLPELTADWPSRARSTRIRHLASMTTGHADETLLDAFIANPSDPLAGFFTVEPQHDPGSLFTYHQPPTLALSAALQRATGRRMTDTLRERVLDPIGIGDLRWFQYRPDVDLGFSGVFTNLDAIARLGQLYLDDGVWEGQRILPEGWVSMATSTQADNSHRPEPDWSRGYGLQFWMCREGFRGDGAYGQFMIVLPQHDTVVAFFSHTDPMQSFMDLIWDVLLPALGPSGVGATQRDSVGDAAIADRVARLEQPNAATRSGWSQPVDRAVGGRFAPSGHATNHPSITSVDVDTDAGVIIVHEGERALPIALSSQWADIDGHPIATSAAVDHHGAISVDIVVTASPHRLELRTDPATSTFTATWPIQPLFGMGLHTTLSKVSPPE